MTNNIRSPDDSSSIGMIYSVFVNIIFPSVLDVYVFYRDDIL